MTASAEDFEISQERRGGWSLRYAATGKKVDGTLSATREEAEARIQSRVAWAKTSAELAARQAQAKAADLASHAPAGASDRQVHYLAVLLGEAIARQDGSAWANLVKDDQVDVGAVARLSSAKASALISELTGGR